MLKIIEQYDPELWRAIDQEKKRQERHIELIASENYVSERVMQAQGSLLTNKYAEGYPADRYYGGCKYVDVVENLAIDRAKELFGADYANVQPHSGSQANATVYLSLLEPGDTIMGMDGAAGGHFTHGDGDNFSGKIYNAVNYGLDENEMLDYEDARRVALEHKPKIIVAGFSSYSRVVDWAKFRAIADEVGAYLLVDMSHISGLVAGGVYPSPLEHADVVTSTTHKTLRGPRGGIILSKGHPELHDKLRNSLFPGVQAGPLMHTIAAKGVAFKEALDPSFAEYQRQIKKNAAALCETIKERGHRILSGGTENHLMVIDLKPLGISGTDAVAALETANITANKNLLPNDPLGPDATSGLRLGTPASTSRGFKRAEMEMIGKWVSDILDDITNEKMIEQVRSEVLALCGIFPVYDESWEMFKETKAS